MATGAQARIAAAKTGMADDDMVGQFDLENLAGSDEFAGDGDVGGARRVVSRWVTVLCVAPNYVESPVGGADVNSDWRAYQQRMATAVFLGLPLPVEGVESGAGTRGLAGEVLGLAEFR